MAIEIYIKDQLDFKDRWGIETRYLQAKDNLPKGFIITSSLEKLVENANGFLSTHEMFEDFKKSGITYASKKDYYLLTIPEDKIKEAQEIIQKSGYIIISDIKIEHQR